MKILLLSFAILLLGCVGGEEIDQNTTNITNEPEPPPITVVIEEQKNQTKTDSYPVVEPEENVTNESYTFDPEAQSGIYFIDVSDDQHGNAIFIKKGDVDILIDAGPEDNVGKVVDLLRSRKIDDIELFISTSADPRMYGGMKIVAENFKIEQLWWTGQSFGNANYNKEIENIQTEKIIVGRGYNESINGLLIEVLNPQKVKFENINNDAMVLSITDRNITIMLTSGIQKGATSLLKNELNLKADILQAPYFGTGEGTRDINLFLLEVDPTDVIITGNQDDSTANGGSREPFMRLLKQYKMNWHNQYELGTIRITTDGNSYAIQNISN